MTMKEAMRQRHTVRSYLNKPLPEDMIKKLSARADENNEKYGLDVRLMTNDARAMGAFAKLIFAKGVSNYFILAGKDAPGLDEKLGLGGADIMLYAQTLGLNTWWAGGTFNRKAVEALAGGKKVIGIIAVGFGATQGTPHKSKKPEDVSAYAGTAPEWFTEGVNAALLAPTALNKQDFIIKGEGGRVSVSCKSGNFSGADAGLVKYHFELGAGKANFEWA